MTQPKSGYRFGNKNQWRRTIWNRIVDRLSVSPRDALVLYLAGVDDFDRTEAKRRGFRDNNLIAVDRSAEVVRKLRNGGALAIAADFLDVLEAWNPNRDVHVVLGDFCCGLEISALGRLSTINVLPQFANAVFAYNFLRGRDSSSNEYRAGLTSASGVDTKHRGVHAYASYELVLLSALDEGGESPERIRLILKMLRNKAQATTLSYRSTAQQTFDSVVWASAFDLCEGENRDSFRQKLSDQGFRFDDGVSRKISATLAHRTMRGV